MKCYYIVYMYKGNDEPLKKSINGCTFTCSEEVKGTQLIKNIMKELKYIIADENLTKADEVDMSDIVILNIMRLHYG